MLGVGAGKSVRFPFTVTHTRAVGSRPRLLSPSAGGDLVIIRMGLGLLDGGVLIPVSTGTRTIVENWRFVVVEVKFFCFVFTCKWYCRGKEVFFLIFIYIDFFLHASGIVEVKSVTCKWYFFLSLLFCGCGCCFLLPVADRKAWAFV